MPILLQRYALRLAVNVGTIDIQIDFLQILVLNDCCAPKFIELVYFILGQIFPEKRREIGIAPQLSEKSALSFMQCSKSWATALS